MSGLRFGRAVLAVAVTLAGVVGMSAFGVSTSMTQSYPIPPDLPPTPTATTRLDPDRLSVAVVAGATGSVAADLLGPYEVFARSPRFAVVTVAASRAPVTLSGGIQLVPDRTFDEPDLRPDVVVVPAVVQPTSDRESPLRAWVAAQAARGARILGVCAGSQVLATAGILEGRRATSHWSLIGSLRRSHPETGWEPGRRYVEDGRVITTAGVTSGTAGALRTVEILTDSDEASRLADRLHYRGWQPGGDTSLPVNRWTPSDLPYALNAAFPWLRPTIGLAVSDGVSETDLAAAAETYQGASFAARTVLIGSSSTVTTRHGLVLLVQPAGSGGPLLDRLVAPGAVGSADLDPALRRWAGARGLPVELPSGSGRGEFAFDPVLRDLAREADVATAVATAKYAEYPTSRLALTGPRWPWRATALFGLTLVASALLGGLSLALTAALARRFHDVRHGQSVQPAPRPVTSSTAAAPNPEGR
jgi:transcriptional regulator GlxA family with amidase domain